MIQVFSHKTIAQDSYKAGYTHTQAFLVACKQDRQGNPEAPVHVGLNKQTIVCQDGDLRSLEPDDKQPIAG